MKLYYTLKDKKNKIQKIFTTSSEAIKTLYSDLNSFQEKIFPIITDTWYEVFQEKSNCYVPDIESASREFKGEFRIKKYTIY